jgi:hypothetical protein
MQGEYNDDREVGGAPSWCVDPAHCCYDLAAAKICPRCKGIPHLPASESVFSDGSRSVWVYFPQGIQRRAIAESDLPIASLPDSASSVHAHHCLSGSSTAKEHEAPPYPGHTVFQDSFLCCRIESFGEDQPLREIHVEVAVDGQSGAAFAKLYADESAFDAADFWRTRVAPFFQTHGVPIERVITRKSPEYCGTSLVHPYETVLATSGVQHIFAAPERGALAEQFFRILEREFLKPALRTRFRISLEILQKDLDHFLETYNSERPSPIPAMHGKPPFRAFSETSKT